MAKINIYNMQHELQGELELDNGVFAVEYNEPLIHQVVVAIQNNARQGTKCTLTRSEVRGHAKKPWKQKGTGRARHGSSKGPQWKGGGVVFAPKPRDFSQKVNKTMRDLALSSALSQKIAQEQVQVIDAIKLDEIKTKTVINMLKAFDVKKSALIVTAENDRIVVKSASNLQKINVTTANQLNVLDIVKNSQILISVDAIKKIEEAYN